MKESAPWSAALIGCGRIASGFADGAGALGIYTHAQAYRTAARTRLVAVCDADEGRAMACARRWGVPRWYTDPRRLLEEVRPDIVSLCTPDDTHELLAMELLTGPTVPRGLLCEKPLALDVGGARRVVEAAHRVGTVLAVNYIRRHVANLRAVRQLIRGGELGSVQAVHGWYTKGVLHNGTHWFDLLRYLLGEVVQVSGRVARDGTSDDPGVDVALRLAGGAPAFLTSCDTNHFTVFEMDIMLEKGRLELRDAAFRPRLSVAQPSPRFAGYTELMEEVRDFGDSRDSILHAVTDLVEAVEEARVPACSGADGVAALAIGEAALISAHKDGTWVEVDP